MLAIAGQRAENDVATLPFGQGFQVIEEFGGNLIDKYGDGCFRQHGELRRILRDQFAVKVERAEERFWPELHFLRHVALNQRDMDGVANWRGPGNLLQAKPTGSEQCGKWQTDLPADQQGAAQCYQQ